MAQFKRLDTASAGSDCVVERMGAAGCESCLSVERLMKLLMALDHDIVMVIRRKPRLRKARRIDLVVAQ